MALNLEKCIEEYNGKHQVYLKLNRYLQQLLIDLCSDNHISIHAITGRVKEEESLTDKLTRTDRAYQDLSDITDICGIRVITYFQNDVDRVGELIEKEFITDKDSSVDKRDYKDPDRFGYASLHVVAGLSADRLRLPEYKNYNGHKFEIQVRSIIQHAWAEIEHNLGYKSNVAIPNPVKRRFFRLAALLEVADQEFSGIADEISSYKISLTQKLEARNGHTDQSTKPILLDAESLKIFLSTDQTVKTMDEKIILGTTHTISGRRDRAGTHVERLKYLGINDLSALSQQLSRFKPSIERWGHNWLEKVSKTTDVAPGISIFYLCYYLACEAEDLEKIKQYLVIAHISGNHQDLAERMLNEYASLKSLQLSGGKSEKRKE